MLCKKIINDTKIMVINDARYKIVGCHTRFVYVWHMTRRNYPVPSEISSVSVAKQA